MTDPKQDEILSIFKETGALMTGHFILRSGLHSGHYFQCARACEYLNRVERLAELLLDKLPPSNFETVVSPAMGGLVIGQEVARRSGKRFIFVEKVADILALRRGFVMSPGAGFGKPWRSLKPRRLIQSGLRCSSIGVKAKHNSKSR